SIKRIGSIKFNLFGDIGCPANFEEGLFSDDTYKGHYGSLYYYSIKNGALVEQLFCEYNNNPASGCVFAHIFVYDKNGNSRMVSEGEEGYDEACKQLEYASFYFCQISEENICEIVYRS
ncbi:MAG: hypothetical protein LBH28_02970, partial [Oscillospiraceae bacterium]|nr:hypothetical protein [Oscillospiraceae bacterium]